MKRKRELNLTPLPAVAKSDEGEFGGMTPVERHACILGLLRRIRDRV